jgi:uncharacterized protein
MRKHYVVLLSLFLIFLICASFWGFKRYRDRPERDLIRRAQAGDAKSQFELAKAYQSGWRHLPKDQKAEFDWCSRAAAQGYAKAQDHLAFMYAKGDGVNRDDVAAFQWLQKAASQADLVAERQLGAHYAMGVGVPQDYVESALWFRKAAEQGDYRSQQLLAAMYAEGKGVRRDSVMAYAWCLVVRAEGKEEDKDKGRVDKLLKQLTPAQELEAQQLASSWWTSHPNGTKMPEYSRDAQQAGAKQGAVRHARAAAQADDDRDIAVPVIPRPRRGDCETGHCVKSVSDDGGIVALEDGSVWRISDVDAVDTFTWLPTDDVIVCDGKLVNTDSSETVEASRLK